MKKLAKYFLLLGMTFSLAACATDNDPAPDNEPPDMEEQGTDNEQEETDNGNEGQTENEPEEEKPAEDVVEFEEQIEEPIEIEGMEEPIVLNLYDNPDAIFITYVPEDLLVEEASGGEGESYKFHANFVGERQEDINLHLYIFEERITEQPSLENEDSTFAVLLEGMEEVSPEEEWYEWSIKEFQSPEGSHHAMLGEHAGQYFVMVFNSTPLYSEGFGPRARKVIEHLYWRDTNDYLVQD